MVIICRKRWDACLRMGVAGVLRAWGLLVGGVGGERS